MAAAPVHVRHDDIFVGFKPIDELHKEFQAILDALNDPREGDHGEDLLALHEHLLRHFGDEECWMRESEFPAFDCHKREHDKVLDVLAEVERRYTEGDEEVVRRLAAELPNWFALHATTMDAALVAWLRANSATAAV